MDAVRAISGQFAALSSTVQASANQTIATSERIADEVQQSLNASQTLFEAATQFVTASKTSQVMRDLDAICKEIEAALTQALASAGIEVPTSCEQGVCGTCLTRVLEGQPDHRDMYLSPEEQEANDQFLPCCSRSKSVRLVLDL